METMKKISKDLIEVKHEVVRHYPREGLLKNKANLEQQKAEIQAKIDKIDAMVAEMNKK